MHSRYVPKIGMFHRPTVPSGLSAFIVEVLILMAAATVLGTEEAGLKMPELS